MATMKLRTLLMLKDSVLALNLPCSIILISSTSFTRLRSKLSYDIINMIILLDVSFKTSANICSRNISEVLRGVRNSCEIVEVKL